MTDFNLAQVHEAVSAAVPDRECIVWRDRRLTYADVTDRSRRLANHLIGRGFGKALDRGGLAGHESGQDHLAIYLHNGNEYLETMLGAYKARVVPFNVNYRYVAEELRYLLADSGRAAIVYHSAFAPTLAEVLPDLPDADRAAAGRRRVGRRRCCRAPAGTRMRCSPRAPIDPTSSGRPTTSTSSTRAARRACRRACSGGRPTSSSARWAGGTSATASRGPISTPSWPRP